MRLDRVWVREFVGRVRLLVELDRTELELDDALVEPVVLLMEVDETLLELEGDLVELTLLLVELALLALVEPDGPARAGRTTKKRRQKNATEYISRFDIKEIIRCMNEWIPKSLSNICHENCEEANTYI